VPAFTCDVCATEVTAEDLDTLVAATHTHFSAAHADFGVTERMVRNYLERQPMLTGPTDRVDAIGAVDIVPISADRVDDVLSFFDHDAFADNPQWASCYCMAHHVPGGETGEEWGGRSWEDNRRDLAERIRSGTTKGVLAYEGGRLVGWCNASKRCEYPDYVRGSDDETTGVVTCFAIAPSHRGHGMARRLLDAAVERFSEDGVTAVEGHPANDVSRPGSAYRGTIPLFREHGFDIVHEGERTTVLRREL
jgi:GNAT superfamily N-acetyltransferase